MIDGGPEVFAHNVEVPRRLTPLIRDPRCAYDRSLDVLAHAKARNPERLTKSSIMVGVGETDAEVVETLEDLRRAEVDVVTIGQYLRPTPKHAAVDRYVAPSQFAEYERLGKQLGFAYVASGPLVRSSYHAAEGFIAARLGRPDTEKMTRPALPNESVHWEAAAPMEALVSPSALIRKNRSQA